MDDKRERNRIRQLVRDYQKSKVKGRKFVPGETFIQYSGDVTGPREVVSSVESLLDGRLAAGKRVEKFENELAGYLGVKEVVTVNSGSSADLIALLGITNPRLEGHLNPGDEVLTCALNFASPVSSIIQNNLKPVFTDTVLGKYTMEVNAIEDALTERTRAILAVHIFGNVCNMDKIMRVARERNLFVIEDCCDSLGSLYGNAQVGSIGDMGTYSFYPAHQITTMEGGAIATNSDFFGYWSRSQRMWGRALPCPFCGPNLAKPCPIKHNVNIEGMSDYDMPYLFLSMGYNSKLTEVQAAFGLEQLKNLEKFNKARRENFRFIVDALKPYEDRLILPEAEAKANPAWYSVPITIRPRAKFTRKQLLGYLRESKIEYRALFTGNILRQPGFRNLECRVVGGLENAELTTSQSFFLGCYQGITRSMREYMVDRLTRFLDKVG